MLAHRLNQENVVHAQQAAGAAKTLSGAKTPAAKAPKTPFGKSVLKANGQENEATLAKKGVQDKSAFITPAGARNCHTLTQVLDSLTETTGPRARAPLGFKTTNAKATAFQTPVGKSAAAPPMRYHAEYPYLECDVTIKTAQKTADSSHTSNPYARRKRASVQAQATPTTATQSGPVQREDIEDEVEYMPPRPEPLPDVPSDDEFDIAAACAKLKVASQSHGLFGFGVRDEEEADALIEKRGREYKEHLKKAEEEGTKAAMKDLDEMEAEIREELGLPRAKPAKGVDTVKAKEAVTALAQEPKKTLPSYAAPTTASKRHQRPSSSDGKTKARHAAAVAASKSTVSYGNGRRVSAKLKGPETNGAEKEEAKDKAPKKTLEQEIHEIMYPPKTAEQRREEQRQEQREFEEASGKPMDPFAWDDLDEEVFQFRLPTLH